MITKYKKQIQPLISIIAQPFLSWNPHLLTSLSLVFAVFFAIAMFSHNYWLATLSWIGVLFDAIDGYVARKAGKVSAFGAFLDSTLDRMADFFIIAAFGFANFIGWWLVAFVILTTFLISYIKARGEGLLPTGIHLQEGLMQRSERLGLLFFMYLLFIFGFNQIGMLACVLLVALNILTILQRIQILKKYL